MDEQLERYKTRRTLNTLPDGQRPCGWWKRYQCQISQGKTMSDAEIRREVARLAKAQTEILGETDL